MSSGLGYPDWQKIQQWIGSPLDEATGAAIGAGAINLGPYNLASWASIVVALKPTGGKVTITVKQKLNGGPATLELDEVFVVNAGSTLFEAVVLFGDVVSVTLQGDTVGETVDYAVYPSNTTTNAQVITNATINVQHNDALVAAEQTIDLEDNGTFLWSVVDDAPNTRVKITPPQLDCVQLFDTILGAAAASVDFQNIPQTYAHLKLVIEARGDNAGTFIQAQLRLNNDSGGNYDWERLEAQGSAITASESFANAFTSLGFIVGAGAVADGLGAIEVVIPNYAGATFRKAVNALGQAKVADGASGIACETVMGSWRSAAAINRLTFFANAGNLLAGTRVTLYGLR